MSATPDKKKMSRTSTTRKPRKTAAGAKIAGSIKQGSIGLRDEVNAYKKELILRVAAETFYEHGYHETTVDMLAERLSGTKAIFYYYYTDKHAVLEEIYNRALTTAQAAIQRAIDEGGSAAQKLAAFARYYTQWVIDNQLIVGVFWREERCLSAQARADVAAEQKKIDDMVARIIKEGITAGDFAVSDIQMTSRAISGMISFTYTWWRDDRRMSRDDAANYYADMALRIAGTPVSVEAPSL
ncbi:transcriptional regulator, TetR family protein [Pusillimonas sp. T7-7]|uniref:TetR/AcrR family transcriptional regulator n=1 Tax=Pusillimonas sp. (strain T7-7) TaxID=1007105 RepID=UPI0002084F56|nr:TetR/AcrR family transcriptional regulator [Pusillimonas sp. T7-7]AEC21210.1 transcriptional regulator, TetR family protein [Pusillimonas sp. T7-7]